MRLKMLTTIFAVAALSALVLLGVRLPKPTAAEVAGGRPLGAILRQPRFVVGDEVAGEARRGGENRFRFAIFQFGHQHVDHDFTSGACHCGAV